MNGPPEISVLLPVHQAEETLESCLRSLTRQRGVELEIVAVDDGATDRSPAILRTWAERDPRIRVVSMAHRGLVAALNRGLEVCRGPLVARMDADDACHPDRLRLQCDALEAQPEVGVVSCRVQCVPRSRVAGGFLAFEVWVNGLMDHESMARERFVDVPVVHPSVVVRRPVLEAAGGWRDLGWAEDHDLWLRLFEGGVRFAKVPETLVFWRDRPSRLTRTGSAYRKESFLRLKAEFLARGPLAGALSVVVWGAGVTGRRLGRLLAAKGVAPQCFVDIDPAKIGRTVGGRPVVSRDMLRVRRKAGTVVVVAVASRGARQLIRAELDTLGLVEGVDYWCAA
jgi:glycosyltransferase involved in cell wall biosynthesis